MVWFALSAALAGVVVDDPSGCTSEEAVYLELAAALGDDTMEKLHTVVDVVERKLVVRVFSLPAEATQTAPTDAEPDSIGEILWRREIEFEPSDCEALPGTIALTVERGLLELPEFSEVAYTRRPLEFGPYASFSPGLVGPWEPRYSLGIGASVEIAEGVGLWLDAEVVLSQGLSLPTGTGRVAGGRGFVGIGPWLGRYHAALGLRGGPMFVYANANTGSGLYPWVGMAARAGARVGRLWVSIGAESPLTQIVWVVAGGPGVEEARLRGELSFGLRFR